MSCKYYDNGHDYYDNKFIPPASGLKNTGVICYFNSLLQGLLSCSSLNKYVIEHKTQNNVVSSYREILNKAFNNENYSNLSPKLWKSFIQICNNHKFGRGQEDASEGLTLLLDSMNNPEIDRLFEHRYQIITSCNNCNQTCSNQIDESFMIEIYESEIKNTNLNDYIISHNVEIDGYKCNFCNSVNTIQNKKLSMLPEIIIVLFKKYDKKWNHNFPEILTFNSIYGKMGYKLVSQTEHSGGRNGGHYWSHSLRNNGIYNLNDTSCSKVNSFQKNNETYLLWYHIENII
jgi:ubiquitin C-terminal hydrolase